MKYCYTRNTSKSFIETEQAVRDALKKRGFGIITEIDAQKTVKEKLGKDMPPYKILGACNPGFAHQAIEIEPDVGVLLPCNVLVRQEPKAVIVSAILPSVQLGKIENSRLQSIATQVEQHLKAAVDEAAE
jgi:uncharacterized protein (DUF302 family)